MTSRILVDVIEPNTTSDVTADTISYTPAGTGAVDSLVQTKLRERVSVKDFGAVGDGVTDDTAFFTATEAVGFLAYIPKTSNGYQLSGAITTTTAAWLPEPGLTWAKFSDSGQLNILRGFNTGSGNGANIWRFADRVFVGEAAAKFAGDSLAADGGTSWFNNTSYPGYLGINATLLSTNNAGKYGIVSAVRTSNNSNNQGICFGAAIVNDTASANGWGAIIEIQHETGANQTFGLEIAAKNKGGAHTAVSPYVAGGGVMGIWFAGGGDATFGGAPTGPANTAMVVLKNAHTWKRALVVKSDALEGNDGSAGNATNAIAINLGRRHTIQWDEPTNSSVGATLTSTVTETSNKVSQVFANNEVTFLGTNGNNILALSHQPNAVDHLVVFNASAGAAPSLRTAGTGTNIDLLLRAKGTGVIRFGTHTAIGAETVTGYITIKDDGNVSRKLAVVS